MNFKNNNLKNKFFNDQKKILIANHTTPFLDGLWLHYILEKSHISHFFYMAYCFNYNNSWIRAVKTPNFIYNESNYLNSLNDFCAVLFPSGGTISWKSGFYYLAKNTNTPIYIINIDYVNLNIEVLDRIQIIDEDYYYIKNKSILTLKNNINTPFWNYFFNLFGYGDECMMK